MQHTTIVSSALAALALGCTAVVALAQGQPRVEVGVLSCRVSAGTGFIFGSTKDLNCTFKRQGRDEHYYGAISRFGIDVGKTNLSTITWAVLAPTSNVPPASLAGYYAGVSGEATLGVGVGANALVGGSAHSVVLQPLSVQAQQGLNVAAGIAGLTLRARSR